MSTSHNPPGFDLACIGLWLAQAGLDELVDAKIGGLCTCSDTENSDCKACERSRLIDSAMGMGWMVSMLESVLHGEARGMPDVVDRLRTALEQYVFEVPSCLLAATILRLNGLETGPLVDDEADEPAIIHFARREPCTAA
jgi:hypothetical protein